MTPTTPSAAGIDPAFIPGVPAQLDGAVPPALRGPGRKPAGKAGKAAEAADSAETAADTAKDGEATTAGATAASGDARDADSAGPDDADSDADAEATDDADLDDGKPVFEVADRRGTIGADREGITFTLDGETAEFAWDEIGAVEIHTPRFGRRFGVTVYTSSRRWFSSDVEAGSRKQLKQWATELDDVLDARFEQDEPEGDAAAEDDTAAATADDTTDAKAKAKDKERAAADA